MRGPPRAFISSARISKEPVRSSSEALTTPSCCSMPGKSARAWRLFPPATTVRRLRSPRLQSVSATIVLPSDAPALKIAAARGYGAELVFYDRQREDREEIARRVARERGLALIPPFDHPHVIAGQGTAAKELFEETGPLDDLYVCLGGGGLLAGSALSARHLSSPCRVIGVEPERGNDGQQSFRAGRIVAIAVPDTIADGARTTRLGVHTFAVIRRNVDDIITVSDADLVETMRFLFERMKIVVEPTGALAAAAVLHKKLAVEGKRIGVIISGGNVDAATFCALLQR